jgi:MFS family permease
MYRQPASQPAQALLILFGLFFVSGFTALLYQVVWQRMLGLFSGSDVHSVTIVIASYLLGLGIGSLVGGLLSDRLSSRRAVRIYGWCNLGIAIFAVCSRFLFYNLLFRQLSPLAASTGWTLLIVFLSLLIPTTLMGLSLPLLSKAVSRHASKAAPRIGLLYGVNTLYQIL